MHVTVYRVEALAQGRSHLAGLDHFNLKRERTLPADTLLTTPNLSLYAFDDETRSAVFVETPPEVDLPAAPFYYLAQKEHALRVFTVAYKGFNALAEELPNPPNLVLLHSVGRCGSTLLCRALGALSEGTTLSEPDAYTCAVGMREPDGSRDAELTELLRSATRFLARRTAEGGVLLIKFRGWCLEVADLLQRACPNARTLFLTRDLEGWMRSVGRLLKLGDSEREADYQRQGLNLTMFTYPRERYITLLRGAATRPETRLEDVALGWTSLMTRYLELYEQSVVTHALTYDDLIRQPQAALQAVAAACAIPINDLETALTVFDHDSQRGTHLSGSALREQQAYELEPDDTQRARAVAKRYSLEPDIVSHLPGNLLAG